jgi:hypothetical protein
LNDLWYYNLTSELWIQVVIPDDSPVPDPRMDMVFLHLGDAFFLHGKLFDFYWMLYYSFHFSLEVVFLITISLVIHGILILPLLDG